MTAKEIAELLRMQPETVKLKARRGVFPCYRVPNAQSGSRLLFDPDEVLAVMRQPVSRKDEHD